MPIAKYYLAVQDVWHLDTDICMLTFQILSRLTCIILWRSLVFDEDKIVCWLHVAIAFTFSYVLNDTQVLNVHIE